MEHTVNLLVAAVIAALAVNVIELQALLDTTMRRTTHGTK